MGVMTVNEEFSCPIAPHRLFHALFVDSHNLTPKVTPSVKSIDFISGDGSPGSVLQVNFVDGHPMKYVKNRLDVEDKANLLCKYTVIECPAFGDKVDFISNEVKIEAGPDGGSIVKLKVETHLKGDTVLEEEEVKARKEGAMEMFTSVIAYLIANPTVYA